MIRKAIVGTLILFAAAILLVMILLPGIARRYAVNHSKKLTGRQIALDKLKINFFTGTVIMIDFKMYEADDIHTIVSFDSLTIDAAPWRYVRNELVIERFFLKGLKAKVVQRDSTFNFDDLVAFYAAKEDSVPLDTTVSEPLRFHLSNIELKNCEFIFDDQNLHKIYDLNDISFFVPYIGWNQEEKSEAGLRFSFKEEGYFESSIQVDPVGGDYEAAITIDHLILDDFTEYVASSININSFAGIFNSRIKIAGNINEVENSLVSGYAEVTGFEMTDRQDRKFLGADKLECVLQEIDVANMSFVIDSLILTMPYVYFEMDTATNNFFKIFNTTHEAADSLQIAEAETETVADNATDPVFYAVNHINIQKGIVEYRDNLTGAPFDYYLSDIRLESDSIESTSPWIDLYAEMLLNKRGTLKASVGLNPVDPMDLTLQYVITDFMLSDLNIYSRFYMGFPIVYGDMYYKSDTRILAGQLTSENKLIITNVELGEKSGGLYDLPMKFALFLLEDRHGVITLDVPVRGDLKDPTVKIGKIVWNTFKNLIIKVAAAPFDLLAGLLSVDPKDIKAIEYQYNDTLLNAARQKQLDLLLELEQKKEGLEIELVYFNDVNKEKEAIAIAEAARLFLKETSMDYAKEEDAFRQFLQSKVAVDTLDILSAAKQITDPSVLDSIVNSNTSIRKGQIERYLHSINDSTQIYTTISNQQAPKNLGSPPVFEVKYSMKNP
jgi:hypothetical protein